MKKLSFLFFLAVLGIAGCYYDKTEDIYPGVGLFTQCDTTHNVSFANHIKPTMDNFCASCHTGSSPSSGVRLETYSDVYQWYQTGDLWGCVMREQGFNPMPPSFALDSCRMNQFKYWILAGAPNN
jgi:hypothetical protein